MSTQAEVNYVDDCQRRVAADTLCYTKKATLVIPAGAGVSLPSDAIRILGCFQGSAQLHPASPDTILGFLSAGATVEGQSMTGVVGRTLYMIPYPSAATTVTLIYAARTPAWESDEDLTLSGPWESLTDQLVQATVQLDEGESSVAANALGFYDQEAKRLRRRAAAKPGNSGRVRTLRTRPRL